MQIAELVLEYLRVLAWPLVVIGAVIVFRRPLTEILRRLRGFKAGSFELDAKADEASASLDRSVDDTGDSLSAMEAVGDDIPDDAPEADGDEPEDEPPAPDDPDPGSPDDTSPSDRRRVWISTRPGVKLATTRAFEPIRQQALTAPSKAVREAHQEVLRALVPLRHDVSAADRRSAGAIVGALEKRGVVGEAVTEAAEELDEIAARAAGERSGISPSGALSYVDAAQKLLEIVLAGPTLERYWASLFDSVITREEVHRRVRSALAQEGLSGVGVSWSSADARHERHLVVDVAAEDEQAARAVMRRTLRRYASPPYSLRVRMG